MKKFSVVGSSRLVFGLSLLGASLQARPAHAVWQIRLVYSTEKSSLNWNSTTNQMETITPTIPDSQTQWQSTGEVNVSSSLFSASGGGGQTANAKQKNTVKIQFHWQPGYNQTLTTDPPSEIASVKLRGTGTVVLAPEANSTRALKNGLGTPAVKTGTRTNEKGQTEVTWSSSNWSGAPILMSIKNPQRLSDLEIGPLEVSAEGSVIQPLIPYNYMGQTRYTDNGANVMPFTSFGATLDNRSVSLFRPGATSEYMDALGVTHGDTIYSYRDSDLNSEANPVLVTHPVVPSIYSNFLGDWSKTVWRSTVNGILYEHLGDYSTE